VTDKQITSLQVNIGFDTDTTGSECLEERYATCVVVVGVYRHQMRIVDKGLIWLFP
jgi:hypothetical protein